MNILVLIKQTFDTEEKISIQDGKIMEDNVNFIINPYDEYAIEEAVKIVEQFGGEVTVLTVGPARAERALRTALAMGADKSVIVECNDDMDEYKIAKMIAAAVKDQSYDLILGGNFAVDSGSGQVAIRLAEELGIPHIGSVTKLTLDNGKVIARRDSDGDSEVVECALPVLITAQQGLNEPRYPTLPGIMKAKKKPMVHLHLDELGLGPSITSKTMVIESYLAPKKQVGQMLEGSLETQVDRLIKLLRAEGVVS